VLVQDRLFRDRRTDVRVQFSIRIMGCAVGHTSAGVGGGAGGSDPARPGTCDDDSACDGAGVMGAPGARSRSPLGMAPPINWLLGAGVMGSPGARSPRRAASRRSISGVVAAGEDASGMPGAKSRWSLSSNSVLWPGDAG